MAAEAYLWLHEQIWSSSLSIALRNLELPTWTTTFQHNYGRQSAVSAYKRIRKVPTKSGFCLITQALGIANPELLAKAKANDLLEKEQPKMSTDLTRRPGHPSSSPWL